MPKLVELWNQALKLKNTGQHGPAAHLFEIILRKQPDFEHGYGDFSLAQCYEDLGRIGDARSAYERAVARAPADRTLLGVSILSLPAWATPGGV